MDMRTVGVRSPGVFAHINTPRQWSRCEGKVLRWTFRFWSCVLVLAFALFKNVHSTRGGIVLPVVRSFSQIDGSGTEEGSLGMTAEHASKLRRHDYQRGQLFKRKLTTVADFPLAGNDFEVGLYYTVIGLGTPSNDYYVQIDTGSDLLWVNCEPCSDCPSQSDLNVTCPPPFSTLYDVFVATDSCSQNLSGIFRSAMTIKLRLYDPGTSATSANASCTSNICITVGTIAHSYCTDNSCFYQFGYGDGSATLGYLVEDFLKYDSVSPNNTMQSASAKIAFGCGFNQTGESLTSSHRAVDGIMGLGRQMLSVISQLAAQELTANEFAHCLQGDTGHGGIFVFGDIQEPGINYTKLLSNEFHYNVALKSIDMNGQRLDIPPAVFDGDNYSNEEQGGTIFDSGTTLAYLVEEAYSAFIDQLTNVVNIPATRNEDNPDSPCFEYSNSDLSPTFPTVTLNFDKASMHLEPTNYLYKQSDGPTSRWCVGWSSSAASDLSGLSILGDLVLKNKLVVYDLEHEQIGWTNFDCMKTVNVSNGSGSQVIQSLPDKASLGYTVQVHHLLAPLVVFAIVSLNAVHLI